jgi:hypothetical protein
MNVRACCGRSGAVQAELDALRVRENAHTREGDAMQPRRRLPWSRWVAPQLLSASAGNLAGADYAASDRLARGVAESPLKSHLPHPEAPFAKAKVAYKDEDRLLRRAGEGAVRSDERCGEMISDTSDLVHPKVGQHREWPQASADRLLSLAAAPTFAIIALLGGSKLAACQVCFARPRTMHRR